MDVKTLSTIIGHVSVATTLNIYTHITETMQRQAAATIDRGIAKKKSSKKTSKAPKAVPTTDFEAKKGKYRKPGTGCISQINENLWEGRYSPRWPDGKRHPRNIYAHSLEECEKKLAAIILEVKAEIAAEKKKRNGSAA